MKKIKMKWDENRVTVIWPDRPLVMAGDPIINLVADQIENKIDKKTIVEDLAQKYNTNIDEAENFYSNIYNALIKSDDIHNSLKYIKNVSEFGEAQLSMATLNLTKKCNLKCAHCYVNNSVNDRKNELSINEIEEVVYELGQLIKNKPQLFIISGGEPTLEIEKLRIAIKQARKADLNIRLNSNGCNIDKQLAEFLSENKVLVQISLDGPNKEIHSILRRDQSSYTTAISAINNLVTAKCRTRISCTVHSDNVMYIPQMIDLSINLGVEQFITSSLVVVGSALLNKIKPVEFNEEFSILYNAVRNSKLKQFMTKSTLLSETINAIRAGIKFTYCGTGGCTCCIDSDGSLYPCINMVRDGYCAGNIRQSRVSDIWHNSNILHKLRELNIDKLNKICSMCVFRYFCGGYCRGETVESGKNISEPYIRCKQWKRGLIKIMDILSVEPDIYSFGKDPYEEVLSRE